MTRLISKTQYNNYETDEFSEEKERTSDEVFEIVEKFPLGEQRIGIAIELSSPLIMIYGRNNDYLKLSLFYNGRFVLYYFNQADELFTKVYNDFRAAEVYIKYFLTSRYLISKGLIKKTLCFKKAENTSLVTTLDISSNQNPH